MYIQLFQPRSVYFMAKPLIVATEYYLHGEAGVGQPFTPL